MLTFHLFPFGPVKPIQILLLQVLLNTHTLTHIYFSSLLEVGFASIFSQSVASLLVFEDFPKHNSLILLNSAYLLLFNRFCFFVSREKFKP